jgi:hypothetical protein
MEYPKTAIFFAKYLAAMGMGVMALIKCRECGDPVSTTANACPKCGAAPAKPDNRNSSAAGALVILVFVVGIFAYARIFIGAPDSPTTTESPEIAAKAHERLETIQTRKRNDFQVKKQSVIHDIDKAIAAKKFDDAQADIQVWNGISDDDLEKRKPIVQAGLIAEKPKKDAENAAKEAAARIADREYFAKVTEDGFLKAGLGVSAKAVGPEKRTLDLDYPLAGKVFMYNIGHEGDFYARVARFGFKKIVVHGSGVTYTMPIDQ